MPEDENLELENETLDETAASDTLKPTPSRSEMNSTFIELMNQLGKEDLTKFYEESIAQIKNISAGVPAGAQKKNLASITCKEDVEDLFIGEELTEEFKTKATVIFEAAVNAKAGLEVARLQEEFEAAALALDEEYTEKLATEVAEITEELENNISAYMDHVVESFMEDNKIAIETSVRADLAESFIEGMKTLFSDHYITVPDEKVDVLENMQEEIEILKSKLNEAIEEKINLEETIKENIKDKIVDDAVEGLIDTQAEKIRSLAESVEFIDEDSFREKVSILKESTNKTPVKKTGLINEEIDGEPEEEVSSVSSIMQSYLKTFSRKEV